MTNGKGRRKLPAQSSARSKGRPDCCICRKTIWDHRDKAKAKSGKDCHAACLAQATQAGAQPTAPPKPIDWDAPEPGRRGPGTPARYGGKCPVCSDTFPAKTLVTKVFAGWAHTTCVFPDTAKPAPAAVREFERNKAAVLSGQTYRGHKASDWRRGGSPSKSGESRR